MISLYNLKTPSYISYFYNLVLITLEIFSYV
jgi:hypothetical protein